MSDDADLASALAAWASRPDPHGALTEMYHAVILELGTFNAGTDPERQHALIGRIKLLERAMATPHGQIAPEVTR